MDTHDLRYEQDMAYNESEEIDRMKAISKAEQEAKEKKEAETAVAYDAALQAEKGNIEAVRLKRLKALHISSLSH
jgi:hypothetical protein